MGSVQMLNQQLIGTVKIAAFEGADNIQMFLAAVTHTIIDRFSNNKTNPMILKKHLFKQLLEHFILVQ